MSGSSAVATTVAAVFALAFASSCAYLTTESFTHTEQISKLSASLSQLERMQHEQAVLHRTQLTSIEAQLAEASKTLGSKMRAAEKEHTSIHAKFDELGPALEAKMKEELARVDTLEASLDSFASGPSGVKALAGKLEDEQSELGSQREALAMFHDKFNETTAVLQALVEQERRRTTCKPLTGPHAPSHPHHPRRPPRPAHACGTF